MNTPKRPHTVIVTEDATVELSEIPPSDMPLARIGPDGVAKDVRVVPCDGESMSVFAMVCWAIVVGGVFAALVAYIIARTV